MGAINNNDNITIGRLEIFNSTHGIHYTQKGPKMFKDCCSIALRLDTKKVLDKVKLLNGLIGWELYIGHHLVQERETEKFIDVDRKSLKLKNGFTTVRYRLKQLSTVHNDARFSLRFYLIDNNQVKSVSTPGTYVMSKHGRLTRQDYAPFFELKDRIGKNCDRICDELSTIDLSSYFHLHIADIPALGNKYIYSTETLKVLRKPVKDMPLPSPPGSTILPARLSIKIPPKKKMEKRVPKPALRYSNENYHTTNITNKRRRSAVSTTESVYSDTDVEAGFVDDTDTELSPLKKISSKKQKVPMPPSTTTTPMMSLTDIPPLQYYSADDGVTVDKGLSCIGENETSEDLIWQLFDFDFSSNPAKQKELYDVLGSDILPLTLTDIPDHLL